jgi:hypothetical protein
MSTTAVRRSATYAVSLPLAALLFCACGGAARPDADETFRRIQVHEATIAHRGAAARACEPDAPCPAAEEVCEAAAELCALAEALGDADALARCELARRRCAETAR